MLIESRAGRQCGGLRGGKGEVGLGELMYDQTVGSSQERLQRCAVLLCRDTLTP